MDPPVRAPRRAPPRPHRDPVAPPGPTRHLGAVNTERNALTLVWITRLRWTAIAGQLLAMGVAQLWLGFAMPWAVLLGILGAVAATNVVATRSLSRGPIGEGMLFALMVFDVCALTALLAFTGGPVNPFNFLYLVDLTLAALILPVRRTWMLVALSIAGFGALFFPPLSEASSGFSHTQLMVLHLRGMWVAFAVAAVLIVYFLSGVLRALAARDAALEQARERASRAERLVALAGLAAGAAHELATPLGTVAIACGELSRALEDTDAPADVRDDVRLIRAQADRCRAILDRMSLEAGASAGEVAGGMPLGRLVADACADLPERDRIHVDVAGALQVRAFPRASVQGLRNVLDNALRAGPPASAVRVEASTRGDVVRLVVADAGPGMPADVLRRVGEPFFTTRAPGQGAGLGLFLARAVTEAVGGALTLECPPEGGTRVILDFPVHT